MTVSSYICPVLVLALSLLLSGRSNADIDPGNTASGLTPVANERDVAANQPNVNATDDSMEREGTSPRTLPTHKKKIHRKKRPRKPRRRRRRHKVPSPPLTFHSAWESEVGYDWLWDGDKRDTIFDRPYLHQKVEISTGIAGVSPTLAAAYRIRGDSAEAYPYGTYKIEPRALYYQQGQNWWHLTLGLQEVTWGEAFGMSIVDVVNPTDASEDILENPAEAKIPVAMINTRFSIDRFNLQLIYVPVPRRSSLFEQYGNDAVIESEPYEAYQDAEYGGRLSMLLPFGLEVKPFYYEHWSRIPCFKPVLSTEGWLLKPIETRVKSYGLSFSRAGDAIVVRGDAIVHEGMPQLALSPIPAFDPALKTLPASSAQAKDTGPLKNNLGTAERPETLTQVQAVIGADYTTSSGETTMGVQVQGQGFEEKLPQLSKQDFYWGSIWLQTHILDDSLVPEFMVWRGLNNHDVWNKGKLQWNIAGGLSMTIELDYMFTKGDGYALLFSPKRRMFSRVAYRF